MIFIYPIYNHNWRNISTIYTYMTRLASNEIFSPSKTNREAGRAKDLSAPLYRRHPVLYMRPLPPHLFGVHMRNIIKHKYQSQTCCHNRAILFFAIKYNLHGFCRNSDTDHNAEADSHPKMQTLNRRASQTLMVKTA